MGGVWPASTIPTNSVLNIVAGGGDGFNGLVLTNYGTVNWTNTPLYGISGRNAQIYNYGLWNAQSDNTFTGAYNGGPPTLFDNFGTFLKSGNTGVTTLDSGVVFNNTGTVNVQSGTLDIRRGHEQRRQLYHRQRRDRQLYPGYTFTNSTTFTGIGSFVAGGATFGGTIVGTLNWDGGSFDRRHDSCHQQRLEHCGRGRQWRFNGLVLTNYGTVNWTNTTLYGISGHNAQIYNYGLWNAQSDNTFLGRLRWRPTDPL